jgi:hypothetical protein
MAEGKNARIRDTRSNPSVSEGGRVTLKGTGDHRRIQA